MHFLTQRYTLLVSLVVLSFIPFCLESIYTNAIKTKKLKKFYYFFGFFGFYLLVDSLISFGYTKNHIEEAIEWNKDNLVQSDRLYTNNRSIAYFSGMVAEFDKVDRNAQVYIDNLQPGEHIAINIRYSNTELVDQLENKEGFQLRAFFANKRNDQVRIYQFMP